MTATTERDVRTTSLRQDGLWRLEDEDWDGVIPLTRVCHAAGYPPGARSYDELEQWVQEGGQMRRFVYLHKGAVVGHVAIGKVTDDQYADRFVTPEYSGPLATIERLLVHPSLRSRGLGSLLFDTALEYIVSLGARPVLDVFSSQSDAIRLYEARGFVQCAELLWRARAEYGVDEPKTVLAMVGPTPARTPQSEAADTG